MMLMRNHYMRACLAAVAVLLGGLASTAWGATDPFHAGIARISVSADPSFEVLVWYPTAVDETPWQAGSFSIPASHNAPIATGPFPIVLLSHGGGVGGGSPLILRDISAYLARQGFVVVAPFHRQASLKLRTIQVSQAFEMLLAEPRFKTHVNPIRLGLLGFSLGGAVALELAGAVPDISHFTAYCRSHPNDEMSCGHMPGGRQTPSPGVTTQAARPAPRAIALLDPFAALFSHASLTAVTMPVLLVRPDQSELPGEGNAAALAAALPNPPWRAVVPGGHFVFTDICSSALALDSPEVCRDPSSVDRGAVHVQVEEQIASFFRDNL